MADMYTTYIVIEIPCAAKVPGGDLLTIFIQ